MAVDRKEDATEHYEVNKINQSSDPDAEDGYIETVHVTPAIDPENVPQYFEHEYGLVIRSYKEN